MRRNGAARAALARKNHSLLGRRQTLPLLACVALMIAPLGLIHPLMALPALAYLSLVLALALISGLKHGPTQTLRIAVLAILSHCGFGLGILGQWLTHARPLQRIKPKGVIT